MPFHHPVRLAVQLALLDNLSKGRIDVGIGKGTVYNEYEFVGHGLRSDDSRARMAEAIEVLERAWRETPLVYEGKYFNLRVPELRPRPVQQPGPPIWRSVISPASFTECGRLGMPILTARLPVERIKERWALYAAGLAEGGHDAATRDRLLAQAALWRNVYVAESDAQAEDELSTLLLRTRAHMMHVRHEYNPADFHIDPVMLNPWTDPAVGDADALAFVLGHRLAVRLAGAGARTGRGAARRGRAAFAVPDRLRRHEPRAKPAVDAPVRRTGDAGVPILSDARSRRKRTG